MATGVLTSAATLYYGPSTTKFLSDIAFSAGTQFNVLWQEGLWYYVSILGGARRNYVEKRFLSVTGAVPTYYEALLPRLVHTSGATRLGPTTNYPQNGTLYPDTTVHYLNTKKEGDFALVQIVDQATGKYKRVWFESMKLGMYSGPVYHRYITGTYNGIALHIIRTHANNIALTTLNRAQSLTNSTYYGINGGFFNMPPYDPKTLNISWQNGTWVPGESSNPNGSGGDYNELGYSAIYWTGSALNFIRSLYGSNISGISSSGTWAQGGASLYLGNSNWKNNMLNNERCPSVYVTDPATGRTAIVANTTTKQVYLIITTANQTLTQFRTAIQSYFGITDGGADNATYKGLMLDGGGSSQLKCRNSSGTEISQPDRTRLLTQIITLVNKT